jgi:hypothetical protein
MTEISQLVEDGLAIKRIAAKLNIQISLVKEEIAKNNLQLKKETFDNSQIERIVKLYSEGVSAKSLAQKFSIRKERIQRWVKEQGFLRSKNESHRFTSFNENAFDVIDTPSKAYWLGFIYADGCNQPDTNTVSFGLKGSDEGHLKKMSVFFGLPEDRVTRKIRNDGADVASFKLYSKHLCERCTEVGVPRAKSLIVQYPLWLEKRLHRHFIRGVFDGDGCIKVASKTGEWNASFVGTENTIRVISGIVESELSIHSYIAHVSENNTWTSEITGNQQVFRFCSWLYEDVDSSIYLDRKHERFLKLKAWLEGKEDRAEARRENSKAIRVIETPNLSERLYYGSVAANARKAAG